jgi:hypothetical protein
MPVPGRYQGVDLFIRGSDLTRPGSNPRMLAHQLNGVIQVPGFQKQNATELFLGLGERAIRDSDFSILETQGRGIPGRLERFSPQKMPTAAKLVVVSKTLIEK